MEKPTDDKMKIKKLKKLYERTQDPVIKKKIKVILHKAGITVDQEKKPKESPKKPIESNDKNPLPSLGTG